MCFQKDGNTHRQQKKFIKVIILVKETKSLKVQTGKTHISVI